MATTHDVTFHNYRSMDGILLSSWSYGTQYYYNYIFNSFSIDVLWYRIKKRNHTRGVLAFISGFWIWGLIGLVAGLGTGT